MHENIESLDRALAVKIGQRIKTLRDVCELSQRQLAEKLGISKSRIAKYETGVHVAPIGLLVRLAEVFGVTVDRLLGHGIEDPHLAACLRELETMDAESRARMIQLLGNMVSAYRTIFDRVLAGTRSDEAQQ